ncbi:citrate/2-methylcitrate synthase [Deinococcus deserti]|uniref:citrate/2-methylcitrate synthase n=1 Tax=Deinococcus deserti TaxID=310783 RepID=UPI000A01BC24|nr:citrate/2-methylcitrate synthase [Deinococcus deserti]
MDTWPEALPAQAARVLSLLYATIERHEGRLPAPDLPLHARLARPWGVAEHADRLRRALVLLSDHKLNVSAFTGRIAASGGASLHHAALCALQGPAHGLAAPDSYELLDHALLRGPHIALKDATRRTAGLAGFGHPLYPAGDPRGKALIMALQESHATAPGVRMALILEEMLRQETEMVANVNLALAALIHALGRDSGDALTLFALVCAAGWHIYWKVPAVNK